MRVLMPILEWLPAYRRAWLPGDLVAGAAVWAVLVPLPLVAYAIFGGSRLFVVGPDAAVAGVAAVGERLPPRLFAPRGRTLPVRASSFGS